MTKLIISSVLIALWTIFVVYCLFTGKNIMVETDRIRTIYWTLSSFAVDFVLYLVNGISIWSIILMIVMLIVTALYISIPSGYNNRGIFIRGFFFPFSKIEDMVIESILRTNRLNFKCFGCFFYIDAKEYKTLKDCEMLYKKEKYHD